MREGRLTGLQPLLCIHKNMKTYDYINNIKKQMIKNTDLFIKNINIYFYIIKFK